MKNTEFIAQILSKAGKQWRNKGSTEPYCFVSSGVLFCDLKTSSSQIRLYLRPDLSSKIQPGPALVEVQNNPTDETAEDDHKVYKN